MTKAIQKHIFYVTILILLFMGGVASIFRSDFEAKAVSAACVLMMAAGNLFWYCRSNKTLP
jgi:hypothetical protein